VGIAAKAGGEGRADAVAAAEALPPGWFWPAVRRTERIGAGKSRATLRPISWSISSTSSRGTPSFTSVPATSATLTELDDGDVAPEPLVDMGKRLLAGPVEDLMQNFALQNVDHQVFSRLTIFSICFDLPEEY
jgi:hypothetical protein